MKINKYDEYSFMDIYACTQILTFVVPQRGVYVSPLKEEVLTNAKQALKVIQKGEGM
jgi:hypothetical protein